MNSLFKKISVSILGLLIITIFVFSIFKHDIKEGLGDEAVIAQAEVMAAMQRTMRSVVANVTNGIRTVLNKTAEIGASISRNMIAARTEIQAKARYASEQAAANARFASERGSDIAARGMKEGRDLSRFSITTLKTTISSLLSKLNMLAQWMKFLTGVAVLCILGGYLWKLAMWFVQATICGFTFLFSFNGCFFWYVLDIIGKIIYLFSWFLFCGLWDFIIWGLTGKWDVLYNAYWMPLMQIIDAIDCFIYDLTGFHVLHFSQNIIEKCYKCEMPEFPKFPDLTDKNGIKDAYNKYGLGSFIPGFKAL